MVDVSMQRNDEEKGPKRGECGATYRALWEKMSESACFCICHFVQGNCMNDPKLFFWNGQYHVFFQHNPNAPFWDTMH